jgi:divalent metal cation (Fe/Co/Zn/Cd) transporter
MDIDDLDSASDDELMSLLGMYALPLVRDPSQALAAGRKGAFSSDGSTALGVEFQHLGFGELGREFLRRWAAELAAAVCGNDKLYQEAKEKGLTQIGVVIGVIGAAIAHAVPALAPYTALLAVLGAFIARTGFQAFCKMLSELQTSARP